MASELHVDAIKHSGGTSALTIDSSGNLTTSANLHSVGHVIQTATTLSTANNGSYTSTSLTHISTFDVAFTPKFSNSLIRITFNGMVDTATSGGNVNPWFSLTFYQDSTDLTSGLTYNGTGFIQFMGSDAGSRLINYTDIFDAGSTSARTYKLYTRVGSTSYTASMSYPSRRRMIVEEIPQ